MQKIKITNLPRWISEIHLKQFFNGCGKIVHASVVSGHGYLIFADELATKKALSKDGAILDGAVIAVQTATEADEVMAP